MVMFLNLENMISIFLRFLYSGEKKTHEWAKITATEIIINNSIKAEQRT